MKTKRKTWMVLSMPPWGWYVAKRGEYFMYAKFHKELPRARQHALDFAKRLNELERRSSREN